MAAILDGASEADLKRMATLWLYSDMTDTNWEAAHTSFDPEKKTRLASFKTVSNRTLSKYKKLVAAGGNPDDGTVGSGAAGGESSTKPKKAAVKKRKSGAENEAVSEDGSEIAVKKTKAAPKSGAKKGGKKPVPKEIPIEEYEEVELVEADSDASGA